MEAYNFNEKIKTYIKTNPTLSHDELGVLLLIDTLYQKKPNDIKELRKINTYLDPKNAHILDDDIQITLIKLIKKQLSDSELKKKLSHYLDMKYSCRGYKNSYDENMQLFKKDSKIAELFLQELMIIADLPEEIKFALKESESINNKDLFELVTILQTTKSKRIIFEILRKIAIIDILTRIRKNYLIKNIDYATNETLNVFIKGLGVKKTTPDTYYFWIDEREKIQFSKSLEQAKIQHNKATFERTKLALPELPIQTFIGKPAITNKGNQVLFMDVRNKLRKNNKINYNSVLEKMIRKNLEFPTQIHDIIGIRIIVKTQKDILELISELETFLGGASLRKKEKNATQTVIHKFGRRPISKYSAKEYVVWKAVYDIALKSSSIFELKQILKHTKEPALKKLLLKKISYYMKRPVNYIVEVQIQDLESYLLSIAKGSLTDHEKLKLKQIRSNSFYKLFPKEIYEPTLINLKNTLLQKK